MSPMMERRMWLAGALGVVAAPFTARAQAPPRVPRIGVLTATNPDVSLVWAAFFQRLRELGYVEGQNVVFERRHFGDRVEQLPALAAELVNLQVDVIVTGAALEPEAAKRATSTIPIVTGAHLDPVGSGLVASLARPGGNVTGFATITPDLRGKQLQLLKEAVPRLGSVAILSDPSVPAYALELQKLETAARAMKMTLHVVQVRAPAALADAVAAAARHRAGAVLVLMSALFIRHRGQLAELAIRNRLPLVAQAKEFAEAGGLMTYGVDLRDTFRGAAGYVDRILKGAKPGDLPVAQPTTFYLAINLKTAKGLGLTMPQSLLMRADQVIE